MAEPGLRTVTLTLCTLCLGGVGGECHVPGCALWMNRAPDIPVTEYVAVETAGEFNAEVRTIYVCPVCGDWMGQRDGYSSPVVCGGPRGPHTEVNCVAVALVPNLSPPVTEGT